MDVDTLTHLTSRVKEFVALINIERQKKMEAWEVLTPRPNILQPNSIFKMIFASSPGTLFHQRLRFNHRTALWAIRSRVWSNGWWAFRVSGLFHLLHPEYSAPLLSQFSFRSKLCNSNLENRASKSAFFFIWSWNRKFNWIHSCKCFTLWLVSNPFHLHFLGRTKEGRWD